MNSDPSVQHCCCCCCCFHSISAKNRREIRTISLNRHRHPTSFPIISTCSVVLCCGGGWIVRTYKVIYDTECYLPQPVQNVDCRVDQASPTIQPTVESKDNELWARSSFLHIFYFNKQPRYPQTAAQCEAWNGIFFNTQFIFPQQSENSSFRNREVALFVYYISYFACSHSPPTLPLLASGQPERQQQQLDII